MPGALSLRMRDRLSRASKMLTTAKACARRWWTLASLRCH